MSSATLVFCWSRSPDPREGARARVLLVQPCTTRLWPAARACVHGRVSQLEGPGLSPQAPSQGREGRALYWHPNSWGWCKRKRSENFRWARTTRGRRLTPKQQRSPPANPRVAMGWQVCRWLWRNGKGGVRYRNRGEKTSFSSVSTGDKHLLSNFFFFILGWEVVSVCVLFWEDIRVRREH